LGWKSFKHKQEHVKIDATEEVGAFEEKITVFQAVGRATIFVTRDMHLKSSVPDCCRGKLAEEIAALLGALTAAEDASWSDRRKCCCCGMLEMRLNFRLSETA